MRRWNDQLSATIFFQAGTQLVVFMHTGGSKDKGGSYIHAIYGRIIAS